MASWQIGELSRLTGVSVRMLRHYEKIGLLKPALRKSNQYRSYSERDLAHLEQIIALRTFGFSLSDIKAMLVKNHSIVAHLKAQREIVRLRARELNDIYSMLSSVLSAIEPSDPPKNDDLMQLIRRYHMVKNTSKSWAQKHLTKEQFKAYVAIYDRYPEDFSAMDQMVQKINDGELGDPDGPDGEQAMNLQLEVIKKTRDSLSEQRHLGADVLKSMKEGQLSEFNLSPAGGLWMMRAGFAFWLRRWEDLYDQIVKNLNSDPKGAIGESIAQKWRELINLHLCVPPQELAVGVMLWQEVARQNEEYRDLKVMPSPKEMAEKVHAKLLFNPDALRWIEQALLAHG